MLKLREFFFSNNLEMYNSAEAAVPTSKTKKYVCVIIRSPSGARNRLGYEVTKLFSITFFHAFLSLKLKLICHARLGRVLRYGLFKK